MSDRPRLSERVAAIGAGSIGAAWAIVFAVAGLCVTLQDTDGRRLAASRTAIGARLAELVAHGLAAEPPDAVLTRLQLLPGLDAALAGATYVQECIPEDLDLKRRLFAELDRLAAPEATLASSSSFLPASAFAAELAGRALVALLRCRRGEAALEESDS